jgi:uncharacterized protein (DUF305 family)
MNGGESMQHENHENRHASAVPHPGGHYPRLLAMVVSSFLAMYVLMYAMVDRASNVFNNSNQMYMAGLMAAPMALIELVLMARMYPSKALNAGIAVASVGVMLLCWVGIRQQAGISDQQFVRSMIPQHAGAILMCEKNRLQSQDLKQLCGEIIHSQRAEIERMRAAL